MIAPLPPGHFFGSSGDNHIAMSRRNNLVPFSGTVTVPYEWVWIVGSFLYLPTFARSMTSWLKECGILFFSRSSFVLNPYQSSKVWVEPFACWCLLLLDSIPLIPVVAMASGSKEGESHAFSVFWFFCAQALVCFYLS
jgi:hypothetical protein